MSYKVFVETQTEFMGFKIRNDGYLTSYKNGAVGFSAFEEKALIFDDWESAHDMCVSIENEMSDYLVCCTVVS